MMLHLEEWPEEEDWWQCVDSKQGMFSTPSVARP